MIAQLIGSLLHKEPTYVILDVGGVGYGLHISLYTYAQIKTLDKCTLLSVLQLKGEILTLYGFYTKEEKAWWLRLMGVNGIGPKIALTILSFLTPIELHQAILNQQVHLFTAIKGIGLKVAQRLLLELSDQAKQLNGRETASDVLVQGTKIAQDAVMALVALGLTPKAAQKAVETIQAKETVPLTLETLIKKALQAT